MTSRFVARYAQAPTRQCSSPGCARTVQRVAARCHQCANRLRRFGAVDQTLPHVHEMDKFVRRLEEARGALKTLDMEALEARWTELVGDCRGRATPTYKDQKVLSYNGWEREAAALIRDVSENISFTRALDLMGAVLLMQHERGTFRSDDALACCTVELMRRAANVGTKVVRMNAHNQTISNSYRREMSRNSRLACARLLNVGLGAAAAALAKRAAAKADQAKQVRSDYYAAVAAIESAASA
jgi:hypothetical protein